MLAVGLVIQTLKIRRGFGSVAVYWAETTPRLKLFGCSIQRPHNDSQTPVMLSLVYLLPGKLRRLKGLRTLKSCIHLTRTKHPRCMGVKKQNFRWLRHCRYCRDCITSRECEVELLAILRVDSQSLFQAPAKLIAEQALKMKQDLPSKGKEFAKVVTASS